MGDYDEQKLARLLEGLPEPPTAWVEAAKALPRLRSEMDGIVERAEADAAYRRSVLKSLEKRLLEAPDTPDRNSLEILRERLNSLDEGR